MRGDEAMATDRFGNVIAAGLPYARGTILRSTEDDFTKLRHAWELIQARIKKDGIDSVFNFTGLERGLRIDPNDMPFLDDELAPAIFGQRLTELALEHLGGRSDRHDVMVFNRLSAATLTAHIVRVRAGGTVIGVWVGYRHPSVTRAAAHVGARFVDTVGLKAFAEALEREPQVDLVVLTRLAVTYEALPIDDIRQIVALARARKVPVYADDAGGARVGPAVLGEHILELARERAGLAETSLVPFEASAILAMLLLRDHGIVSVHFAGMPPGTSAMLFKFVPPETLQRFGGAMAFAEAVDGSLSKLAALMGDREQVRALLLGLDR